MPLIKDSIEMPFREAHRARTHRTLNVTLMIVLIFIPKAMKNDLMNLSTRAKLSV